MNGVKSMQLQKNARKKSFLHDSVYFSGRNKKHNIAEFKIKKISTERRPHTFQYWVASDVSVEQPAERQPENTREPAEYFCTKVPHRLTHACLANGRRLLSNHPCSTESDKIRRYGLKAGSRSVSGAEHVGNMEYAFSIHSRTYAEAPSGSTSAFQRAAKAALSSSSHPSI